MNGTILRTSNFKFNIFIKCDSFLMNMIFSLQMTEPEHFIPDSSIYEISFPFSVKTTIIDSMEEQDNDNTRSHKKIPAFQRVYIHFYLRNAMGNHRVIYKADGILGINPCINKFPESLFCLCHSFCGVLHTLWFKSFYH